MNSKFIVCIYFHIQHLRRTRQMSVSITQQYRHTKYIANANFLIHFINSLRCVWKGRMRRTAYGSITNNFCLYCVSFEIDSLAIVRVCNSCKITCFSNKVNTPHWPTSSVWPVSTRITALYLEVRESIYILSNFYFIVLNLLITDNDVELATCELADMNISTTSFEWDFW